MGASAQADLDIGALYERLQREVSRTAGTDGATWAELRDLAERHRVLGTRSALRRRPGVKGTIAYSVKRLVHPLLRWYVDPIVREQRMFNDAALRLIDALAERHDERA